MLYAKALSEGLSDLPPADPKVRLRIEANAEEHGWPALHARLSQVDPLTAARLKPNDSQRVPARWRSTKAPAGPCLR